MWYLCQGMQCKKFYFDLFFCNIICCLLFEYAFHSLYLSLEFRNAHLRQFKLSIYREIWIKIQLIDMDQILSSCIGQHKYVLFLSRLPAIALKLLITCFIKGVLLFFWVQVACTKTRTSFGACGNKWHWKINCP